MPALTDVRSVWVLDGLQVCLRAEIFTRLVASRNLAVPCYETGEKCGLVKIREIQTSFVLTAISNYKMKIPDIEPITKTSLPEYCQFLYSNLDSRHDAATWEESFHVPWNSNPPNYGYLIRDENQSIVGGIGAIYSEQLIKGKAEPFCNITSWCVLEEYRAQSLRLALAIVGEKSNHITNFSPTPTVSESLKFLKFKELDDAVTLILNMPWFPVMFSPIQFYTEPDQIESVLPDCLQVIYKDHRSFVWLKHLLLQHRDGVCYVIYKVVTFKSLPAARVIYISNPSIFSKYSTAIGSFLLFRHGIVTTRVESRFLDSIPRISIQLSGYTKKIYLSSSLGSNDICNLYSESVCMDL